MGTQGYCDLKKFLSMDSKYKSTKEAALRYSQEVR